jgi:hypothetical protein
MRAGVVNGVLLHSQRWRKTMGKYGRLTGWLERQPGDRVELSFEDIEDADKISLRLLTPTRKRAFLRVLPSFSLKCRGLAATQDNGMVKSLDKPLSVG